LSGNLGGGGGVEGLNSRGASFRGRSGAAPWIVLYRLLEGKERLRGEIQG
jgi:hypothetical protein